MAGDLRNLIDNTDGIAVPHNTVTGGVSLPTSGSAAVLKFDAGIAAVE